MTFALDPRLEADTLPLGELPLSRALVMNDARFPWVILVPRLPGLREIIDLAAAGRGALMEEIAAVSEALREITGAEKLNIGALGNRVAQLHVHVVARFSDDVAWPGPVWGHGAARPYAAAAAAALAAQIASRLRFV